MTAPEQEGPTSAQAPPNPEEVNTFHRYDDLDTSDDSHHHTLGRDPNQSSPGPHTHDGTDSPLISQSSFTDSPIFVQDGAPVGAIGKYLWVQTNIGPGGTGLTFWVEDGKA